MKEGTIVSVGTKKKEGTNNLLKKFKNYFILPLGSGIFGFAIFFLVLVLTKVLTSWLGIYEEIELNVHDVYLSSIGFVLLFLIKILEYIKALREA